MGKNHVAKLYSDGRALAEVVEQLRSRWYSAEPALCDKWFKHCKSEINKWLKREYEYDEGPLEGELRNPDKKLRGYGEENANETALNLKLWMQRANMSTDGTYDGNNDCSFNDIDDDE